jgi:class 3 adenylate cyclase
VRQHFHLLTDIVAAQGGAVVKTIGDAVMATFPAPDLALAAALRMRDAIGGIGSDTRREDLLLKIGIHERPCRAVMLNDRLDYFGQTVNIAARVQGLAVSREIFATRPVVEHPRAAALLQAAAIAPRRRNAALGQRLQIRLVNQGGNGQANDRATLPKRLVRRLNYSTAKDFRINSH